MKKEELQLKTDLLLANIQFIDPDRKQYIDWAIELLLSGIQNEYLYILAGLEPGDWFAIERYFEKAAIELEIDTNIGKTELVDFYIVYNITKTLENPSNLDETIKILQTIYYYSSFYYHKHFQWINLYDELEELTGITAEEYVLREFKYFLEKLNYENDHTTKTN